MDQELVELVENTAKVRGEMEIPREFIVKALEKIEAGGTEVERYPSGHPSLRSVFEIAVELQAEAVSAQWVANPTKGCLYKIAFVSFDIRRFLFRMYKCILISMAKRNTGLGKKKKSHSKKTQKRLEIKREMLAKKASKQRK